MSVRPGGSSPYMHRSASSDGAYARPDTMPAAPPRPLQYREPPLITMDKVLGGVRKSEEKMKSDLYARVLLCGHKDAAPRSSETPTLECGHKKPASDAE